MIGALAVGSLAACAETLPSNSPIARAGDRGYRCDDGRLLVVRQTDPAEIALDLGNRRLYLRRQGDGSYAGKGATLSMTSDAATLATPPDQATACKAYDPHGALPPPKAS